MWKSSVVLLVTNSRQHVVVEQSGSAIEEASNTIFSLNSSESVHCSGPIVNGIKPVSAGRGVHATGAVCRSRGQWDRHSTLANCPSSLLCRPPLRTDLGPTSMSPKSHGTRHGTRRAFVEQSPPPTPPPHTAIQHHWDPSLLNCRGRLKRSACTVRAQCNYFGRLAVVETHILWYFGHHCCFGSRF